MMEASSAYVGGVSGGVFGFLELVEKDEFGLVGSSLVVTSVPTATGGTLCCTSSTEFSSATDVLNAVVGAYEL